MMQASDIREVSRLEKNAKRLRKAAQLVQLAYDTNNLSDLDLGLCIAKLDRAATAMLLMRSEMMGQ